MPNIRETILLDMVDPKSVLTKDMLKLAVRSEQQRRAEKGYSFTCFVVGHGKGNERVVVGSSGKKTKISELGTILGVLKADFTSGHMKDATRVQLLVQQGVHWTAVDLQFDKTSGISAFVLDAAGDDRCIDVVNELEKRLTVEKQYPKVFLARGGLQYDPENCSVFSLHHVFKSSKIGDLHLDLDQRKGNFSTWPDFKQIVYRLGFDQLAPSLVTTIQRSPSLHDYIKKNPNTKDQPVTKKGHTISQIVWGNTEMIESYGIKDHFLFSNTYIERVKGKAKQMAERSLRGLTDAEVDVFAVSFNKKMHVTMQSSIDLPAYHVRSVSGLLTEGVLCTVSDIEESRLERDTQTKSKFMFFAHKARALADDEPVVADELKDPAGTDEELKKKQQDDEPDFRPK